MNTVRAKLVSLWQGVPSEIRDRLPALQESAWFLLVAAGSFLLYIALAYWVTSGSDDGSLLVATYKHDGLNSYSTRDFYIYRSFLRLVAVVAALLTARACRLRPKTQEAAS